MIKSFCENVLLIFGTVCGVCIMSFISYGIINAFINEFNLKFGWHKNGYFKKREKHND